jgi:hypothetical protein
MLREVLPGPRLYALLDHEFDRSRPKECVSCRMPLPYHSDDANLCNWQVGEIPPCAFGCHALIAQIIAAVAARYDIAWPAIVYGRGWGD